MQTQNITGSIQTACVAIRDDNNKTMWIMREGEDSEYEQTSERERETESETERRERERAAFIFFV